MSQRNKNVGNAPYVSVRFCVFVCGDGNLNNDDDNKDTTATMMNESHIDIAPQSVLWECSGTTDG